MKHLMFVFAFFLGSTAVWASGQPIPIQRTPEEIAMKQTEMLTRNLNITDSLLRDTLYKVHLRFAQMRHPNPTIEEIHQHRQAVLQALQGILTPQQYNALLRHQQTAAPRGPKPPVYRIAPADSCAALSTTDTEDGEANNTPTTPPGYLL